MNALRRHYPEYLMEAAGLGLFMISATMFTTLLEHPESPIYRSIADPLLRRSIIGIAMGLTAISIIYSPWGKQSGAHLNPAVTLTFFRLGKIKLNDVCLVRPGAIWRGIIGDIDRRKNTGNCDRRSIY